MKNVYLVKERSMINGRKNEFCGIAYYSSYKKALQDYKEREEQKSNFYSKIYDRTILDAYFKTHEAIFQIDENHEFQIILEQHEVY